MEKMYSKTEMINEFASLLKKMDEFIREWEQNANMGSKDVKLDLIEKLNTMKKRRFQIKKYLDDLQNIDEQEFLQNQEDFQNQLKEASKTLDQSMKTLSNK